MARLSGSVRRLTAKLRGQHATSRKAQLAAMSYEELEAEVIKLAVRHGYPGDPAQLDVTAANEWIDGQIQAFPAVLPDGNAG